MEQKAYIIKYASTFYRQMQIYLSGELKPYGIGAGQQFFLEYASRFPGISLSTLANAGGYDAGTATRAIDKLASLGYVRVEQDANDKRARCIYVLPEADETLAAIRQARSSLRKGVTRGMTQEEKLLTGSLLKRLSENAAEFMQERRDKQP